MKTCSKCKINKELVDFHKGSTKSGKASSCKACRKITCKNYTLNNPDKRKESIRKYYIKNSKSITKKIMEYRTKPGVKDSLRAYKRSYKKLEHVKKLNAFYERSRQAKQLKATPKWANLEKIKEIYKNCPKGMEVDHIIPLKGKNISGLHIETNLQYLTKSENSRKGNRYGG